MWWHVCMYAHVLCEVGGDSSKLSGAQWSVRVGCGIGVVHLVQRPVLPHESLQGTTHCREDQQTREEIQVYHNTCQSGEWKWCGLVRLFMWVYGKTNKQMYCFQQALASLLDGEWWSICMYLFLIFVLSWPEEGIMGCVSNICSLPVLPKHSLP